MTIYNQATIGEIAKHGNMDPAKLLACVRETFPRASLATRTTGAGMRLAFSNYEKRHNIKQGGPAPSALNPTSGTAPVGAGDNLHREVTQMSNEHYDEYAVDAETKRQWEADAGIRQEFHGDYESFQAFRRAESQGLVKIQGGQHV